MRVKSLHLAGWIILAAATLHGQTYWSTNPGLDCTGTEGTVPITNPSGATIGYSCVMGGTFNWFAAGGPAVSPWSSQIRFAAPASAPVLVDYTFYDTTGTPVNLDYTAGSGSSLTPGTGNEVTTALYANQPWEVDLLGLAGNHSNYETGSVYAVFYCPDPVTCGNVTPQLLYQDFGSVGSFVAWSLSAPITWDIYTWTQWSAEGIDDGVQNIVSFVVCNEDYLPTGTPAPTSFTIDVFDSNGNLAGSGTTPPINAIPLLGTDSSGNPIYGEGGTYGVLLSSVITTPLPSGTFKILVDGGGVYSSVEVLQFTGSAATTLQVAYDTSPSVVVSGATSRSNVRHARMVRPKHLPRVFPQ